LIIENPLQFVYWNIRKFLAVVLSIQIGLWIVIALEALGLTIPLVRPILGTLYVIFIPGSLVLRQLNLRKLSGVEVAAYSIGLSITIAMALGLLLNTVFVALRIPDPISEIPLLTALGIVVSGLCAICYVRNYTTSTPPLIDSKELLTPAFLLVSLLLPLTIFGAFLLNHYQVTAVNIVIIALIVALILVMGLKKHVDESLYPYVLFVLAVTLLLRNSLVTNWIWGTDINIEYYLANSVVSAGFWNPQSSLLLSSTVVSDFNAMLSVAILPPVLSLLTGLSLVWVYKTIYPLIFSFVPLVVYVISKKQTGAKIAFAAGLIVIISSSFYTELLQLPRQEIAELFVSLLILVMVSSMHFSSKKNVLLIVFGMALVVSLYSSADLFAFLLLFALLLVPLISPNRFFDAIKQRIPLNVSSIRPRRDASRARQQNGSAVSVAFVLFLIIFAFAWFTFVNGAPFVSLVVTTDQIISATASEFFSSTQTVAIATGAVPPMQTVTKYLYFALSFFAVLGLASVQLKRHELRIQKTYFALAVGTTILLIACTTLPFFASALQTSRFYQFAELVLAPFMVVGMVSLFGVPFRKPGRGKKVSKAALQITSVFLAVFLLFNSGIMYTLAHEPVWTPTIVATDPNFAYPRWTDAEVESAAWLHIYHATLPIYSNSFYRYLLYGLDLPLVQSTIEGWNTTISPDSYVFMGPPPNESLVTTAEAAGVYQNETLLASHVENMSKIFDNGRIYIYG
jgi:uncharacterized membrane protein